MKTNLLGQGGYLLYHLPKKIEGHHFLGANHLRAKAALKIADIADLDVDLDELFRQGLAPYGLYTH